MEAVSSSETFTSFFLYRQVYSVH